VGVHAAIIMWWLAQRLELLQEVGNLLSNNRKKLGLIERISEHHGMGQMGQWYSRTAMEDWADGSARRLVQLLCPATVGREHCWMLTLAVAWGWGPLHAVQLAEGKCVQNLVFSYCDARSTLSAMTLQCLQCAHLCGRSGQ